MATDTFKIASAAQPFLARLRGSAFIRNVLLVITGSAIAQAIGFALSPLISRLFSPADFGIFGSFNAVASVIGAVVTLQYSHAIMLPTEDNEAISVLAISCVCTLLLFALCLPGCLVISGTLNGHGDLTHSAVGLCYSGHGAEPVLPGVVCSGESVQGHFGLAGASTRLL